MANTKRQQPSKQGNDIRIVELDSYVRPSVKEAQSSDEWIAYGEDNAFFKYVNDRYYGSPTNNAIINGMSELVYGGGLRSDELTEEEIAMRFPEKDVFKIAQDLKRQGNAAVQVVRLMDGSFKTSHLPVENLRAEKASAKGLIENYYYSNKWSGMSTPDDLVKIPAFNAKKPANKSILYINNYQPDTFYYSPPDYVGSLPYAELEEEVANYHINNIKNSFAPSTVINYNNGVPDKQTRDMIEEKTRQKFTGSSNAGRIVVAFNDNKENAVTMESFQLNDAHNQYDFLSGEARRQIMVGHRVTSPMLFGIKDNTGLGNNAEELETASRLMDATVIRPKQNVLTTAFEEVFAAFGRPIELYFENIQPIEITEENQDKETAEPAVEMAAHDHLDEIADDLIECGQSEDDILDEYELFDVSWAEDNIDDNIEERLNEIVHFDANQKSAQDGAVFKVRYLYKETAVDKPKDNTHRPLCSKLMSAGLIYRKEDIVQMSSKGGAEDKGQQYNVFLHKGGANCQHGWERRIFRKRLKKDGEPWGGGAMNGVSRARIYDAIRGDAKVSQAADKKAYKAPRDTPKKGYK